MQICSKFAFCSKTGAITENVFADVSDAEMWGSRLAQEDCGTLYMYDADCWVPMMVYGLSDDDTSIVARGMAFVRAVDGGDYGQALEEYLGCEEIPQSIKDALMREIRG